MKVFRAFPAMAAACLVIIADQASKTAIRAFLNFSEQRAILPGYFNLCHARNTGAVWGLFQQQNMFLVLFSFIALLVLAALFRSSSCQGLLQKIAVGCVAGGIIGNLVDRVRFGWVTDFLDFHWQSAHWPCFNLADSAICIGVMICVASSILEPSHCAKSREGVASAGADEN